MCESNLSEIPSESIRKAICECIENRSNSKNFEITVSSASKGGENNFCGIIYRVSFIGEDERSNGNDKNFSLIVKLAPQNVGRRIQFHSREMFLQEIFIYHEVLPCFRQFEHSNGVNIERDGFIAYPECYQAFNEEPNECLLLEDLCVRSFKDIDRCCEELTADHVRLVMKILGKFHALSLALKDQQPQKFSELSSNIKDVFIRTDINLFVKYFDKVVKSTMEIFDVEKDADLVTKLEKLFAKDAKNIIDDCFDLEETGFASVISHGDAWQNNVMFRYNENRKPIEACFLDWQVTCHSSPIIDIVFFLFCCTTKDLRDSHYNDFLTIYYESISAHIQRLNSNPEKLFPRAMMQEHLCKFGKYGLILATIILPLLATEEGNGLNMDGMADNSGNHTDTQAFDALLLHSQNKFNKRLRDIVIDMAQLGYI